MKRPTLFIIGDSQVGKTSIARIIYQNHEIMCVSETDQATEHHVYIPGREFTFKILEIRNCAFLSENAMEFDESTDLVIFCYAIDNPVSFQHVADMWIPLFYEHVNDKMEMILIGNKIDLRHNAEVLHNLAEQGLQPVDTYKGTELLQCHGQISCLMESESKDSLSFEKVSVIVNDYF